MNKETFIANLRSKLNTLDAKEVDDMMAEYSEYIDDKINDGATEEEAIEGFGNIDDLAYEIIDAYKVDKEETVQTPKKETSSQSNIAPKQSSSNVIDMLIEFIQKCFDYIGNFYHDYLSHLTTGEIIKLLIIFILAITLIRIPLALIQFFIIFIIDFVTLGTIQGLVEFIVGIIFNIVYLISIVVISISFYKGLRDKGDVDFSTLFKSPFKYFSGKKDENDQSTNDTIDMVNDTINTTVTTASKAIEDIIAKAKERTANKAEKGE